MSLDFLPRTSIVISDLRFDVSNTSFNVSRHARYCGLDGCNRLCCGGLKSLDAGNECL